MKTNLLTGVALAALLALLPASAGARPGSVEIFNPGRGFLPVYYGIGGRLLLNNSENGFGVRVPVGLDYIFEGRRFDIFLQFAPVLELPRTPR